MFPAGREALLRYGAGTASVRFICGTFSIHGEIEAALARLHHTQAALTYVSCWTAGAVALWRGDGVSSFHMRNVFHSWRDRGGAGAIASYASGADLCFLLDG